MKRILFVTLAFVFATSAAIAAPPAQPAAPSRPADGHRQLNQTDGGAEPGESALPTISKYQTPHAVPNIGCGAGYGVDGGPCTQDDGSGTGYSQGGCNCNRICYEAQIGCNLGNANIGCIAGTNGALCKSCSGQCYNN